VRVRAGGGDAAHRNIIGGDVVMQGNPSMGGHTQNDVHDNSIAANAIAATTPRNTPPARAT